MLAGQPPFLGATPQAIMARHAMDSVPNPQVVRATIPDDLQAAIMCALSKAPTDRYRTGVEFSEALGMIARQ